MSFTYKDTNTAGEQMMNIYDGVSDLVSALSQSFNLVKATTDYDLRTMRLVAANDPDLWFTISWDY